MSTEVLRYSAFTRDPRGGNPAGVVLDALGALMARHDWLTVNLVWRENATTFHARNPFPPGGVVEDPATGAAAAALGAYLRAQQALPPTRRFVVHQGSELGRPSLLTVCATEDVRGGIRVSGAAVSIDARDDAGR